MAGRKTCTRVCTALHHVSLPLPNAWATTWFPRPAYSSPIIVMSGPDGTMHPAMRPPTLGADTTLGQNTKEIQADPIIARLPYQNQPRRVKQKIKCFSYKPRKAPKKGFALWGKRRGSLNTSFYEPGFPISENSRRGRTQTDRLIRAKPAVAQASSLHTIKMQARCLRYEFMTALHCRASSQVIWLESMMP